MNPTITIRLPEELKKDLNTISKKNHVPISDLVRNSIKNYITTYQFRQIRKKILPLAESQGILTDDDVFKLIK